MLLLLFTGGGSPVPSPVAISTVVTPFSPVVSVSTNIGTSTIGVSSTLFSASLLTSKDVPAPVVNSSITLFGATPVGVAFVSITPTVVTAVASTYFPAGLLSARSYFRPSSDSSVGSWTITPLWSKVGEIAPYDGDYISSEAITSGTTSIAKLVLTT